MSRLSGLLTGRVVLLIAFTAAAPAGAIGQEDRPNECRRCHAGLTEPRLAAPAAAFDEDVHRQRGFTCVDCHGGDPKAVNASVAKAAATGFRGVPRGAAQIQVCGRCHSDAALMRKFSPKQRVDQVAEYASSGHGKRLAAGDARVATCASCHGAHGIRVISDVKSPVYAANVAATCGSCHANPAHMKRPDGTSPPTTQLAEYEKSVHFAAMTKRQDLSAPTCNDCHGNHGAMPPGIDAVSNVCGTCHAVFAARFNASPHQPVFEKACLDCHGNHAVLQPSDEMLGGGASAICSGCHADADDPGRIGAVAMRAGIDRLKREIASASALIERARSAGMEIGDQDLALGEARNQLVRARTEIHAFNAAALEPVVADGLTITAAVDRAGRAALRELSFRRRGLVLSLSAFLLVVVALWLKIRQLDRRELQRAR